MSDVEIERREARRWLRRQASLPAERMPSLARPLFLVTGYTDEDAMCWQGEESFMRLGPRIYRNWDTRAHMIVFPRDEVLDARHGALAGRAMDSFLDFGDLLRQEMLRRAPEAATDLGYDVLCHSMGGLDAAVALMGLEASPPRQPPAPAGQRLGKAHHLLTLDTPWRGVPSMDFRRKFAHTDAQKRQGGALFRESPQLALLAGKFGELPSRVHRLTCYRPEGATQIEVPAQSADLYGESPDFRPQREACGYTAVVVRGASHSGERGITRSPITLEHVFRRRLGVE